MILLALLPSLTITALNLQHITYDRGWFVDYTPTEKAMDLLQQVVNEREGFDLKLVKRQGPAYVMAYTDNPNPKAYAD